MFFSLRMNSESVQYHEIKSLKQFHHLYVTSLSQKNIKGYNIKLKINNFESIA